MVARRSTCRGNALERWDSGRSITRYVVGHRNLDELLALHFVAEEENYFTLLGGQSHDATGQPSHRE